jgi:epoxyqueuosine reductase
MKDLIRAKAGDLGFDACGFARAKAPSTAAHFNRWLEAGHHGELGYMARNAAKRIDPAQVLPRIKTIIALGASYHGGSVAHATAESGVEGIVARYARFSDYHNVLGRQLTQLVESLKAWAGPKAAALWYVDTGPVLERDWAQAAGLGFIGKHTNLINRQLGNWFFLCEILTDVELEPDRGETNHCGTCTRCIAACPTQAIRAPFSLDARRCISYLTIELKDSIPLELRPAIGERLFGCDDCLAVCPWNRFAQEGRLMQASARSDLARLDLQEVLRMEQEDFLRRFAGTPIERLKLRRLKRNACVVLGNVGSHEDLSALEAIRKDSDPMIAEHAEWARQRIEQRSTDVADGST